MLTYHPIPASNYLRENYVEVRPHFRLLLLLGRVVPLSSTALIDVCLVLRVAAQFFGAYNNLLRTSSFVVQVSAFQLLSALLFERSNHDVMMKYVNDADNLKLAMTQLKNPNRNLQLAVFHVLKVFVPNPYKADPIVRILTNNKQRFLAFLHEFEKDTSQHITDHTTPHHTPHTHTHTHSGGFQPVGSTASADCSIHGRRAEVVHSLDPLSDACRCRVCGGSEDDVLICHKREMVDAFLALDDRTLPLSSSSSAGQQAASTAHQRHASAAQSPPAV